MKKYLFYGIALTILGFCLFGISIGDLSAGNYVGSVIRFIVSLMDWYLAWDAFSNYKKTKN